MAEKKKAEPGPEYDGNEYWTQFRLTSYVRAQEVYGDAPKKEGDPDLSGTVVSYNVIGEGTGDTWNVEADEFHQRYKPLTPVKT